MSKVRSSSHEEIPYVQGQELCPLLSGPAVWRYPMSKVREIPIRQ